MPIRPETAGATPSEIGLVVAKGQIKFIKITCSESLAERPGA
jgi:hypothetical protein